MSLEGYTDWTSLSSFEENTAYYISSAKDLAALASLVNAGNNGSSCTFYLTDNIDLSEIENWTPIGNSTANYFGGTLDGQNFQISNLNVSAAKKKAGGLFLYITNATIQNLTLDGQVSNTKQYVGGMAYQAENSRFYNCVNKASLTAYLSGGGFVCTAKSVEFVQCTNYGTISGRGTAGFAFECKDESTSTFDQCTNNGSVTNPETKAGKTAGIVLNKGGSTELILRNCVNNGDITSYGAAYGLTSYATSITSCKNYGNITSHTDIARGIGEVSTIIDGCINYGSISGYIGAAGVGEGYVTGARVSNCQNYGTVKASTGTCGGIAGALWGDSALSNCTNFGEVTGNVKVGGIVSAVRESLTMSDCYNHGNIYGSLTGAQDEGKVGGLIGSIEAPSGNTVIISNCYNSGSLKVDTAASGGLIGEVNAPGSVTIKDCYNAGAVSASSDAGGLVGYVATPLTIANCYSAASSVTASDGTAGTAFGSVTAATAPTVSNLFARSITGLKTVKSDTSGLDYNAVTPRTYPQMTDSSFVTHLGSAFAQFSTDIYGGQAYNESDWETYKEYFGDYPFPILVSACGASPLSESCNVQFLGAQRAVVTVNGYETYATTVAPGSTVSFTIDTGAPEFTVTSVTVGEETLEAVDGTYTCTVSGDTFIVITLSGDMIGTGGEEVTKGYPISFNVSDGENTLEDVTITVTDAWGSPCYAGEDGVLRLEEGTYTVAAEKDGYYPVKGTMTVTSAMSKEEANIISFTLYPDTVPERTITLHIIAASVLDGMRVYNGDLAVEEKTVDSSDVSFTLPAGSYMYSGVKADTGYGSGPLTIADQEEPQTLTLRAMDMSTYGLDNKSSVGYTVTMKAADGTEYFPGSLDAKNGGGARGWFLLPASTYGEAYEYAFLPVSDFYWGSHGTTYLYSGYVSTELRDFNGLAGSQSDTGKFVIAPKATATITVPTGASLQIGHRIKFYEPLEIIEPTGISENGGQTTYTFDVPSGQTLHYELEMPGYVKKAATFTGPTNLTVTTGDMVSASSAATDKPDTIDSAILTNAPDSHYIELGVGQQYELYLYRNWQATNSITGNYYVDPDYTIEVISGSSVAITDHYYAGAMINAVSEGVSVIRITYDALDFVNTSGSSYVYSKLYEKNTTVLVVNVGGNGVNVIDSGCGGAEYEIEYFIRSVNGTAKAAEDQCAKVTFKPSSNVSKVELHAPVGSTGSWSDTWSSVKSNGDGTFTANLTEGSNVLRFTTSDGIVSYHVLRAMGLDVTATSAEDSLKVTLEDGGFVFALNTNDELTIDFDGLQMPLPKLAALINPGLESVSNGSGGWNLVESTYAQYTLSGENTEASTVTGKRSQYDISTKNALTLKFAAPDTYTLSDGKLHTTSFGAGSYIGMTRGGYTGPQPTRNNGINTRLYPRTSPTVHYSAMPDIKLVVTELVKSSDAGVGSVTVSGVAGTADGNVWNVVLPYGSTISADGSAIVVEASHELATVSTPVTADGGKTWTFTVTAQDGTTQDYTVNVSVSTVYAKVTFYLNGGTCSELDRDITTVTYTADKAGNDLPVPTKKGYTFEGWYDTASKDTGKKYTKVSSDLPAKLYALWSFDEDSGKITVTFSLIGSTKSSANIDLKENPGEYYGAHSVTWISATTYKVDVGSTVYDVFVKALDEHNISYTGAENNYVSTINGMSEFTNGKYSGWKYSVNGVCPDVGLKYYTLSSGDVIVWYYVNDYRFDGDAYDQSNDDETLANKVEKLIDAIGNVTLNSEAKIKAARKAYDDLTYKQKQLVENYETLVKAEEKFAELKKANDRKQANAVIDLIKKISKPITLNSESSIRAARTAYDKLTADQKKLVSNYKELTNAETALARLKATDPDKDKAKTVSDMIDKLGDITLDSEEAISAARKAYDKLTDLQKALVENYDVLEQAEATLAKLKAASAGEDIYKTTGDYLESLGTPTVGSIGGEWMVIGLARSGRKIPDAYYDNVVKYVRENINKQEQLHNAKSTDNSRVILALTALGKDVTNVDGHNLLVGLSDMDYVCGQGINGPIWALIALDSGNYPVPKGNVTREALIQVILEARLEDGGWAFSGDVSDPDMTAMALQALAPYCKENDKVKNAVDGAVQTLSQMQNSTGGFTGVDGNSSESISQVIVALTALGIDPAMDARFVKDGISAFDALLAYYVSGGGFKHVLSGELDGMATEQAYYALAAYYRFIADKTSLYNMADVVDMGGDVEIAATEPTEAEQEQEKPSSGFPWWIIIVVFGAGVGAGVCLPMLKKKGKSE